MALLRARSGMVSAPQSRAELTRSPSSAELLLIRFLAAQSACCGALGGQCFNGPQQALVTQLTLPLSGAGISRRSASVAALNDHYNSSVLK